MMQQSQVEALDHSAPLFPSLPRRHLESETYFSLVRILSHCSHLSRPIKAAIEGPKQGENELEISTEPAVCNEQRGTQNSEVGTTTGCVSEDRMGLDGTDNLNSLTEECCTENNIGQGSLEDKDPGYDLATHFISQNDQFSVQDVCMEESLNVGFIAEGKGLSNSETGEDIGFSFDDLCVEADNAARSLSCGRDETEEATQEMQPMESEKSPTLAAAMCSPLNINIDEEDLEEGEIMGVYGVDYLSNDVFNEDTTSLANNKVDQALNDEGKKMSFSESIPSMVENKYGSTGKTKIHHMNGSIPNVGEKRKLAALVQSSETKGNNATSQGTSSAEKDITLKKKRGPLTEQRKEKRKRKKKIKQAEKNREQGVKRMKIEPIVKPKKVKVCRHYLKGRCHEDNCKFSHDEIPLTKSTFTNFLESHLLDAESSSKHISSNHPCCHFARKSCMKGDSCPYDHQLSKYPCNNYATKGFCGRGTDCMFSHEVTSPVGGSLQTTANISGPQLNSSSAKSAKGVNSEKQLESMKNVVEAITKPPSDKGIAKFLFGESLFGGSLGNITQPGSSSRKVASTAAKVDPPTNHQKPDTLKEALKQANKGRNFLSFGKAPTGGDSVKKCDDPGTSGQVGPTVNNREQPEALARGIRLFSFGRTPKQDASSKTPTQLPSSSMNSDVMPTPSPQIHIPPSTNLHPSPASESLKALFSGTVSKSQKEFATPNIASKANITNMPTSSEKSLLSILAFADKYESKIKMGQPGGLNKGTSSSSLPSTSGRPTILDLLKCGGSKNKQ